ncbi:glucose-1-phosphate adenylyltransferase subunit GlgD [Lachnoclostridium sp. An169]|uniref:glucose-1-phosphate adenylyltransferase subunit GlgD n=1 Tax=Lachnoclostridium sp. An169 TaxID=1965569 RepID=UPI000B38398B|nr:glucose-1-phosphate adenylyltransferase subunit GlgD [Lachnoclostridium sp. An169]OUP83273.1 glucose-1-phosphate adenylyltransferase subunit GlgD [Lachnoclostridium sp. An169]HJA68055.1 glucose-1-phosphate adenylyltransferase subunit GlgD [Candidatus Mediterraneibacter cottocaccae]
MVNSNIDALGIIFPNSYDDLVPDLVADRLMASIPFGGRYRMIDFILSSMVNCGIDNVSVIVRKNYHSLLDHLGSGREWDLTRKNGGLNIVPPFAEKTVKVYNGRVEALASILGFLKSQKEKYVVMADTNIAVNFDFGAFLEEHIASGADVTIAYREEELPPSALESETNSKSLYYTLELENKRVTNIRINSKAAGVQNFSMNIYAIERELLIDQISQAFVRGYVFYERDILSPHLVTLNVQGYRYDGYCARICDMRSYYEENMKLLDDANLDALFDKGQIYTKIRDDNPTRYIPGARAKNVMVADGCVIEGDVENCILFRGVKIRKGAKVRNCVLMQDTVVESGADIDYVITDKNVVITENRKLRGADTFQVFVEKGRRV